MLIFRGFGGVKDVSHENGVGNFSLCLPMFFVLRKNHTIKLKEVRQTTSVNCSETL